MAGGGHSSAQASNLRNEAEQWNVVTYDRHSAAMELRNVADSNARSKEEEDDTQGDVHQIGDRQSAPSQAGVHPRVLMRTRSS